MSAFFDIGGRYAAFVVPAYALSLAALAALAIEAVARARRWRREAEEEADD